MKRTVPCITLAIFALLAAVGPISGQQVSAQQGQPTLAGQVLQMLQAGLSAEVILDWLASQSEPAAAPSAGEMVALKEAGASDGLLRALLARARGEEVPVPPPAAPPAAAPQPPAAPEAPPAAGAAQEVLVTFRLSYEPRFESGEEEWDLFVYLDGKPLSYVPRSGSLGSGSLPGSGEALELRRRLAPGPHLLRVTQERHQARRRGRWLHAARVAPAELAFELTAGRDAEVEVTFHQGWPGLGTSGPLTFRAVQGERVVEAEEVGGDPEEWPALCEEIEASTAGPDREDRLEGCVRWQELWGGRDVPGRDEVRRALEAFDYRPVPRGS